MLIPSTVPTYKKIIIVASPPETRIKERPGLGRSPMHFTKFQVRQRGRFHLLRNKSHIDIHSARAFRRLDSTPLFSAVTVSTAFDTVKGIVTSAAMANIGRRPLHRKGRLAGSPDMYAPVCNDGHVFIGDRIGDLSPIVIGRYRRQGKR